MNSIFNFKNITCVFFGLFYIIALSSHAAYAETTEISRLHTIDSTNSVGSYSSTTLDINGNVAISYWDSTNRDLKLWVDDGAGGGTAGDGIRNGSEIRTIESGGNVGEYTSITLNRNGNLAISYYDTSTDDLKLWIDDGVGIFGTAGDGIANGSEIRIIDSAGAVGLYTSIALNSNGYLAISYFDFINIDLKLWVDDGYNGGTAGDGIRNGGEIRTIDSTGNVGTFTSIALDNNGNLAVSYLDSSNFDLKLWIDDGAGGGTAGDGIANGSEIRTIDSTGIVGSYSSLVLNSNGYLAIAYLDITNNNLKLWVDDSTGGGTAGDGIVNGSEIRTIDNTGDVGRENSIALDSNGNLAISYYDQTNDDLKLWVDDGYIGGTASDGIANGSEIRTIDRQGDVGLYSSMTLDPKGSLAISYYNETTDDLKLAIVATYNPRAIDSAGSIGQHTSLTLDSNRNLAVSYYDQANLDLKLWVDDGASGGTAGDGIANGGEIRTIDSAGSVGRDNSITLDSNGNLAISYYDQTNTNLKLWIDDGAGGGTSGDGIANGSEIRIIDSPGVVGLYTHLLLTQNNLLAISYYDSSNFDLKLWIDDGAGGGTSGDGRANGSEIRIIDSTNAVGAYGSMAFDNSGNLAISYYFLTTGDLKLWVDDGAGGGIASDGIANGNEIRIIDSANVVGQYSSLAIDSNGRLAISYSDFTNLDLKLWLDDGAGGGTAGDGLANGSEIRTIDSAGSVGEYTSLTLDSSGNLAISYYDASNFDLKLWVDDGAGGGAPSDGIVNGSEIRTIDSAGSVGQYTSLALDRNNNLAISYYDESNLDLKLFNAINLPGIKILGNAVEIANGNPTPDLANHTDFGSQEVSSGTVSRTFSVENTGSRLLELGVVSVSLSGANAADFNIATQANHVVNSSGTTTFVIEFNPSASGLRTATVAVRNNIANENPYTFTIQGNGTIPEMNITGNSSAILSGDSTPSTADHTDFGTADSGLSESITRTFTIDNSGSGILTLTGNPRVALSGVNADQFSVVTQPSATVASNNGTSVFQVRFLPTSSGTKNATLSIANDDADENPYTFAIRGISTDSIVDSDGDGVPDAQEVNDGTDPNDSGSTLRVLPTTFCAEWNGFLDGLWNIMEYVNLSSQNRKVVTTIKNISGLAQSSQETIVPAGAQRDVLVHDMLGWIPNSYGQVCVEVENANPGDIDGRMVYYKPNTPFVNSKDSQLAFANPFFDGLTGDQYVFFNTYQPSLDSADIDNLVANWLQLVNLDNVSRRGTLTYYGQDGNILASQNVTIDAGSRMDFSGHQFGKNLVGTIKWSPEVVDSKFQMRNVRYYYDNAQAINSFDSAFQLEGQKASGALLIAAVDTRSATSVVEIGNTLDSTASVNVMMFSVSGAQVFNQNISLPANGSTHIIVDSIIANNIGTVQVQGPSAGSTVATVMQYGRAASGGIQYIYGTHAKQALGSVLKGTYNTFLEQGCSLLLASKHSSSQDVTISAVNSSGENRLSATPISVPANGVVDFDLCRSGSIGENVEYGVVTVQPATINTIVAEVIRKASEDAYRFPTPVRQ